MKAEDFAPGDPVLYVPKHAGGNVEHKDCERGTVVFCNETYVFVRYGDGRAQPTAPEDLMKLRQGRSAK